MVVYVLAWLLLANGFVQGALFENKQAACRFRKCCNESSLLNAYRLNKQQAGRLQGYFCQAVVPHVEEEAYAQVLERDHTQALFLPHATQDDHLIVAGASRITFWDAALLNNTFSTSSPHFFIEYNLADRSCLACSSRGDLMAVGRIGTGEHGNLLELWDVSNGVKRYPSFQRFYGAGEGTIEKLLFSYDSRYLFVGVRLHTEDGDGYINVFDLQGTTIHLVARLDNGFSAEVLELSLDGQFLASLSKRGFHIWDLSDGWTERKIPLEIIKDNSVTKALFFSPCGRYLFSVGLVGLDASRRTVFDMWDLSVFKQTWAMIKTKLAAHNAPDLSLMQAIQVDGNMLMPLYSMLSDTLISHGRSVYAVSPLGHIACKGENSSIIIWNFARMEQKPIQILYPQAVINELMYPISSLNFSSDGSRLVCAGNGKQSVLFRLFASLEPLSFNYLINWAISNPSFNDLSSGERDLFLSLPTWARPFFLQMDYLIA